MWGKVGKIQVSRQFSQQLAKQVTNPNADGKRDDVQTQGLEQHWILAQENPQYGALQTCPLSWQQHIFLSSARDLLMCKAKENVGIQFGSRTQSTAELIAEVDILEGYKLW